MKPIFLLLLIFGFLAVSASAQEKSFKILSFVVDGKEVEQYTVAFEIRGKEITPVREGNKIIVPEAVNQSDDVITIRFKALNFNFGISHLSFFGEGVDYIVEIDTPPFSRKNLPPEKKLVKAYAKKCKGIGLLKTVPPPSAKPNVIIEGITFTTGLQCKK